MPATATSRVLRRWRQLPANAYEPAGTACGDPSDSVCDNPNTCNATGFCLDNFEPTTTLCRDDAGDCDVPEYCDGGGSCPANAYEPAGTACGDPSDSVCDNPTPATPPAFASKLRATTTLCRDDAGDLRRPRVLRRWRQLPANAYEPPARPA